MAHWLFLPDDVTSDLATLATISSEKIEKLRELLDSGEYQPRAKSFVKVAELLDISDESAAKLCTFLDYVQRQRAANDQDGGAVLEELERLLKKTAEDKALRAESERLLLFLHDNRKSLVRLFAELPGYVHSEKVRDLEQGPMPHLHSFRAYCDVRPVYDAQAEEIVSCFPVITLSLVTHRTETGEMQEVLIQLTEPDLAEFRKQFTRLDKKLTRLKTRFPGLSGPRKGETNR